MEGSYLVFLVVLCGTLALPQNYGSAPPVAKAPSYQKPIKHVLPDHCRIEHKLVHDAGHKEVVEKVCEQLYKKECHTDVRRQCHPYEEEECETVYEKKCQWLVKDNCYEALRDIKKMYTEDECKDEEVKVCEKHWITKANNEKIWGDDPATCNILKETKCSPVTKYRTVSHPYNKCDKVSYEDCNDVPKRSCHLVAKQKCYNKDYGECEDVPYEECEYVHKQVPVQLTKRLSYRVCQGDDEHYELTDEELEDPIGPRQPDADDIIVAKVGQDKEKDEKPKTSSAIISG